MTISKEYFTLQLLQLLPPLNKTQSKLCGPFVYSINIYMLAIAINANANTIKYICLIKRLALHDPLFVKV